MDPKHCSAEQKYAAGKQSPRQRTANAAFCREQLILPVARVQQLSPVRSVSAYELSARRVLHCTARFVQNRTRVFVFRT
jgi:hypothetical protein